jgi:hypothetical protein
VILDGKRPATTQCLCVQGNASSPMALLEARSRVDRINSQSIINRFVTSMRTAFAVSRLCARRSLVPRKCNFDAR